ncbi:Cytochrome b561 domain-containing protein [Madurella fahalii]|uniref:Cytochrome b561 domain-containing protein n=1 Tax=Madurella fahalii TaxID=1157608 RepID=A0ABQ0GNB4_9PEZI
MIRHQAYHGLQLVAFAWLILEVSARGGGGSGGYGSGGGGGFYGGSGSSYGGTGADGGGNRFGGSSGFRTGAGFDVDSARNYRRIHGILAALAMVLLFPIGSILLRVLPGRIGFWAHAIFQALAFCVYVAAAALGIYLVRMVQIPGSGSLLEIPSINYHPIIGIVLLVLLVAQPVFGFVHHSKYKKVQKRQIWSYLHLVNGRIGIALGIINGGLGLHIANASNHAKIVYASVAAVMGALWVAVAIWAEVRRIRRNRQAQKATDPVVVTKVATASERSESED